MTCIRAIQLNEQAAELLERREFTPALEVLVEAAKEDPANVDVLYNTASCFVELGRTYEALEIYVGLAQQIGDSMSKILAVRLEAASGVTHPNLNSCISAAECLAIARSCHRSYDDGSEDDPTAAADFYRKATELNPCDATAWADQGQYLILAYQKTGQAEFLTAAGRCFKKAMELNPEDEDSKLASGALRFSGVSNHIPEKKRI